MKAIFVALLAVVMLQVIPTFAAPTAESPLLGRWTLDIGTLPMPPEARPKSVTLDFRDAAGGKLTTRAEIVDQSDNKMHAESTLSLDGTPGRASGTYWVDVLAAKMPAPNVLVMQFVYEGIPRSTRVYSVSADGRVLTETEAYFKEDGTPVMRTAFFTRAPGQS
ncbi:hypothetical protein J2W94_000855 [Pseudoxanthomonas sacheonensis]|uniref:LuxR family transcriptional regulator n=1 Tax=Pseudoxanthomonas sacheonensis TaxID=443615 RepID=A0ABU1RP86_9GAMM|nr:hypothetical protein [Pseudoxanthomonas sacheonensis]